MDPSGLQWSIAYLLKVSILSCLTVGMSISFLNLAGPGVMRSLLPGRSIALIFEKSTLLLKPSFLSLHSLSFSALSWSFEMDSFSFSTLSLLSLSSHHDLLASVSTRTSSLNLSNFPYNLNLFGSLRNFFMFPLGVIPPYTNTGCSSSPNFSSSLSSLMRTPSYSLGIVLTEFLLRLSQCSTLDLSLDTVSSQNFPSSIYLILYNDFSQTLSAFSGSLIPFTPTFSYFSTFSQLFYF